MFSFNKIKEQQGRTGLAGGWGGWEAQTIYTHLSKCKNDKRKKYKNKIKYQISNSTEKKGKLKPFSVKSGRRQGYSLL
jgi:CRISPR/Cas system CSM-associated protein Csm5 (group 7 of RAMP superfamily)